MIGIQTLRSGFAELLKFLSYVLIGALAVMACVFLPTTIQNFQGLAYTPNKLGASYYEFSLYYGNLALGFFAAIALCWWVHHALLENEAKTFFWRIIFLGSTIVTITLWLLTPLLVLQVSNIN